LSINNTCHYEQVITYLLHQQFYYEPNFLIDRTSKKKILVNHSHEILYGLQEKLIQLIPLWEEGKEKEFMKELCNILQIDLECVYNVYKSKADNLPKDDMNENHCLRFMFALSETIHLFHEKSIAKAHEVLKAKSELDEEEFTKVISFISQNADPDLSLFQNFYILLDYASITGHKIEKIVIAKTYSKVLKKIKKHSKNV